MRWEQGRLAVDRMLEDGELQRVPSSRGQADMLIAQGRGHIASARTIADADPPGAYS